MRGRVFFFCFSILARFMKAQLVAFYLKNIPLFQKLKTFKSYFCCSIKEANNQICLIPQIKLYPLFSVIFFKNKHLWISVHRTISIYYSKILMEFSLLHPTSSIIISDCYSFSNNSFFYCYNCKKISIVCKHFQVYSCLDYVVFSFNKGTLLDLQFEFSFSFYW